MKAKCQVRLGVRTKKSTYNDSIVFSFFKGSTEVVNMFYDYQIPLDEFECPWL